MLTLRSDQPFEGGLACFDDVGPVPFGFEIEPEAFGQVVLVFDDEDAVPVAVMPVSPWAGAA